MNYTRGSIKLFFRGDPTLKGVWSFTGNARDESGYGYPATIVARVAYGALTGLSSVGVISQGEGGGALPYPQIVVVPTTVLGTIGTGDFTIMFRIYPVQPKAGNCSYLFFSSEMTGSARGPLVIYDPLNIRGLGDGIVFRVIRTNHQIVTSPAASDLYNRWLLVTFLRNNGNCQAYYDNELKLSFTDTTYIPAAIVFILFSQEGDLWMNTGGQGREFACWRRALSPQEISAYYRWSRCYLN